MNNKTPSPLNDLLSDILYPDEHTADAHIDEKRPAPAVRPEAEPVSSKKKTIEFFIRVFAVISVIACLVFYALHIARL